jgi:hypothetical protein
MQDHKRPFAFWVITVYMSVSMLLLFMGQAMALIDYDYAVKLGLQESVKQVSSNGVQVNRAFGAGDTLVYIPLIALSVTGLIQRKRRSLLTTAAVMGVSAYWATTVLFMLVFLPGAPGYYLVPGMEYWLVTLAYAVSGVCGLLYLVFRGDNFLT